jgi:hypothetical protein
MQHVHAIRAREAFLKRAHLLLIRLQRSITLLSKFLRPFRILLQQIMRLCEPYQTFHQRPIVLYERLYALRERLHTKRS